MGLVDLLFAIMTAFVWVVAPAGAGAIMAGWLCFRVMVALFKKIFS